VELALIELLAQRDLGLHAQLAQPAVAVKVGDRLARPAEGVAIGLLLRERL